MARVSSLELIKRACEKGCAVPAFNIDNLESAIAVSEAMRETGVPLIVQTIPRTLRYGGKAVYSAMMSALMEGCKTDYAMHLDHGDSAELAAECVRNGYTSVMFDGSGLSFDENVRITRGVAEASFPKGVSVEGELGKVGGSEESSFDVEPSCTDVGEAVEFTAATKVSALAVSVGNAHGVYKGVPRINLARISELYAAVDTPLVLHGASGLSDATLRDCIKAGIRKINFATELRGAYTEGIKRGFARYPDSFDPKVYMRVAIDGIKEVVFRKIEICNEI